MGAELAQSSRRRLQLLMDGDVERNPGPVRPGKALQDVLELTADIHPTTATKHAKALNLFDQFLRLHDLDDSAGLFHRGFEPLIEGTSLSLRWGFGAGVPGSGVAGTIILALRRFILLSVSRGVQVPDSSLHFKAKLATFSAVRVSHACTFSSRTFCCHARLFVRSGKFGFQFSVDVSLSASTKKLVPLSGVTSSSSAASRRRFAGVLFVWCPCAFRRADDKVFTRKCNMFCWSVKKLLCCGDGGSYGLLTKMVPKARLFRQGTCHRSTTATTPPNAWMRPSQCHSGRVFGDVELRIIGFNFGICHRSEDVEGGVAKRRKERYVQEGVYSPSFFAAVVASQSSFAG